MKPLLSLAILLLAMKVSATPSFSVTAVGLDSVAGINDRGQIVGTLNTARKHKAEDGPYMTFEEVAVREAGRTKTLGAFEHQADCVPVAVNAFGEIVGTARPANDFPGDGDWSDIRLFRWRQGRFSRLSDSGEVLGMNDHGQTVGFRVWPDGQYGFVASRGRIKEIRNPLDRSFCEIASINNAGFMTGVVYSHVGPPEHIGGSSDRHYAYLWPPNGKPYRIEALPNLVFSEASGVNDGGQVIGYVHFKDDWAPGQGTRHIFYRDHAFLWHDGTMTLLDRGRPDIVGTRPTAINNTGSVIGGARLRKKSGNYQDVPFLYRGGILYDLNALLPAGSRWKLQTVSGMNNRGQIIGSGTHNGVTHTFLLTPVTN